MAVYCPNCGAQINPGGKFCQACGTPTPQASGPSPGQYAYQQPTPQAPPKSGGALKVVLIVLAVIIALGAVGIIGAVYWVKRAVEHAKIETGSDGKAEVSFGGVKISAGNTVTEEQLGVPIYPGAKAGQGAGGITMAKGEGKSVFIGGATFTTDDSVEQVAEFYKNKLGDTAMKIENYQGSKQGVVFKIVSKEALRTITISNNGNDPTNIVIANVAK